MANPLHYRWKANRVQTPILIKTAGIAMFLGSNDRRCAAMSPLFALASEFARRKSESEFVHFIELSRTDIKGAIKWREAVFAPSNPSRGRFLAQPRLSRWQRECNWTNTAVERRPRPLRTRRQEKLRRMHSICAEGAQPDAGGYLDETQNRKLAQHWSCQTRGAIAGRYPIITPSGVCKSCIFRIGAGRNRPHSLKPAPVTVPHSTSPTIGIVLQGCVEFNGVLIPFHGLNRFEAITGWF